MKMLQHHHRAERRDTKKRPSVAANGVREEATGRPPSEGSGAAVANEMTQAYLGDDEGVDVGGDDVAVEPGEIRGTDDKNESEDEVRKKRREREAKEREEAERREAEREERRRPQEKEQRRKEKEEKEKRAREEASAAAEEKRKREEEKERKRRAKEREENERKERKEREEVERRAAELLEKEDEDEEEEDDDPMDDDYEAEKEMYQERLAQEKQVRLQKERAEQEAARERRRTREEPTTETKKTKKRRTDGEDDDAATTELREAESEDESDGAEWIGWEGLCSGKMEEVKVISAAIVQAIDECGADIGGKWGHELSLFRHAVDNALADIVADTREYTALRRAESSSRRKIRKKRAELLAIQRDRAQLSERTMALERENAKAREEMKDENALDRFLAKLSGLRRAVAQFPQLSEKQGETTDAASLSAMGVEVASMADTLQTLQNVNADLRGCLKMIDYLGSSRSANGGKIARKGDNKRGA